MTHRSLADAADEVRTGWRFPVERRHMLNEGDRQAMLEPERLLDALRLLPGDTAVDVGAGTGFWTIPLAKRVGSTGRVIAVDVEPVMLDEIRTLAAAERIEQIELIRSEEVRVPVDAGIAAAAVLGFVLHEPADPGAFLREVKRLLAPNGRLLVIDWQKWETEKGPPVQHRISLAEAKGMVGEAGFAVEELRVPTPDAYALLGSLRQSL